MYHDRDLFWYASDAGVYNFQLQQTDEGVNLVPVSDLISEYDIDAHLATVVWASEGIVVNGTWFPIDDDLLRYDRYYSKDVEHVPETKPVTQTARSEPEVDVYMEERTWPGLAEFLRYIVENGESVSDYVYTPKFSQKFIDDFGMAYPEFGLQDHARASGSTSSAPTSFFISGNYYVDKGRIFDVAINDARICVYDKNLATGTQQICMWSRPPAI